MAETLAYSVKDAAKAAGLSVATLYRAMKDGKLVAKAYGSRTLIPAARLRAFLEEMPDMDTPKVGPKSKQKR